MITPEVRGILKSGTTVVPSKPKTLAKGESSEVDGYLLIVVNGFFIVVNCKLTHIDRDSIMSLTPYLKLIANLPRSGFHYVLMRSYLKS